MYLFLQFLSNLLANFSKIYFLYYKMFGYAIYNYNVYSVTQKMSAFLTH